MANWPYNTSNWQQLRLVKLSEEPLCYACQQMGRETPAQAVDHVVPIRKGGHPFPALDGLMSLCLPHHNEKTARLDRGQRKPFARRFQGFDVEGNPIDPGDDWHRGGVEDGKGRGRAPSGEADAYLVSKRKGPENGA